MQTGQKNTVAPTDYSCSGRRWLMHLFPQKVQSCKSTTLSVFFFLIQLNWLNTECTVQASDTKMRCIQSQWLINRALADTCCIQSHPASDPKSYLPSYFRVLFGLKTTTKCIWKINSDSFTTLRRRPTEVLTESCVTMRETLWQSYGLTHNMQLPSERRTTVT